MGPQLHVKDQFGWAMSGYRDVDGNGIREIFVGAPGDDEVDDSNNTRFDSRYENLTAHSTVYIHLPVVCELRSCLFAISSSQEVPSHPLRRGQVRFDSWPS